MLLLEDVSVGFDRIVDEVNNAPEKLSNLNIYKLYQGENRTKDTLDRMTGYLLKRAEGPIDFTWRNRYFVLENMGLKYYNHHTDPVERGIIDLENSKLSVIREFDVKQIMGSSFEFLH